MELQQNFKCVGVTRDVVRGYCKRNGLNGIAQDSIVEHQQSMIHEYAYEFCLHCGEKLKQNNKGRRKNSLKLNVKANGKN
ncbi:hypothetical protein F8154_12255 [Alkaliphilus pronyensis]|uniref:Uncharacterized protein n=1 Tax=Alkaliphilus pronyensis TaxID=1482732 RepID=A0A6I0EZB9_9FIRM|nr:hypothetical protein [Alkaliphilus pronyensis]KAB3532138.1 hypothetical protein F8154_12255 [Alkaliphilus pronyensis]